MYGWSQILQSDSLSAAQRQQAIEVISRSVKLQNALIEDLLDVSRIVSGKMRLEQEILSLLLTTQAAVEAARPAAEKRHITIDTTFDSTADQIFADKHRLQQIINNLLANAIKFSPEGGTIHVTLSREGYTAKLVVQDSGTGIEPELLPYVFERFRQADTTDKRKFGGLGLGLTIVKSLVELHGGEITVHSEGKDRGATFTVCLPLVPERMENEIWQTAPGANDGSEPNGKPLVGIRILLVDDEQDALDLMRFVLTGKGASLTCASSAQEAVVILANQEFDLLISDLGMPGLNGYDLIAQVREILPVDKLPAIALTGYVSSDDREKVLRAGFQAHLPKPVKIETLPLVVLSVTRNRPRTLAQG
jgi:CheY-like chemotaxis protein